MDNKLLKLSHRNKTAKYKKLSRRRKTQKSKRRLNSQHFRKTSGLNIKNKVYTNQFGGSTNLMTITYPNNVNVDNTGKPLTVSQTTSKPKIKVYNKGKYLLTMTDPNAPVGTWVHMVSIYNNGVEDVKIPYMGPSPPKGSGVHNYIFRLYSLSNQNNIENTMGMNSMNNIISQIKTGVASHDYYVNTLKNIEERLTNKKVQTLYFTVNSA
jgi:phosphatidylethanolamine-binding protein (PEBP) family uncharacterized protein